MSESKGDDSLGNLARQAPAPAAANPPAAEEPPLTAEEEDRELDVRLDEMLPEVPEDAAGQAAGADNSIWYSTDVPQLGGEKVHVYFGESPEPSMHPFRSNQKKWEELKKIHPSKHGVRSFSLELPLGRVALE